VLDLALMEIILLSAIAAEFLIIGWSK